MRDTPLPGAKDLRDLLQGMLNREVEVAGDVDPVTPATPGGVVAGVYVTDALRTAALVALDLPLAARSGAALALLPARAAEAAVDGQVLTAGLRENVTEILNVTASLLNADGAPHVRLHGVHGPEGLLPADVAAWLRGYGRRLDTAVHVKGYGGGGISVLVL